MRAYRQMKTIAQLGGLFPPEPEVTLPTQELFEQFFESHGLPNEAESELLQAAGYVDAETLEAWCKCRGNRSDLKVDTSFSHYEALSPTRLRNNSANYQTINTSSVRRKCILAGTGTLQHEALETLFSTLEKDIKESRNRTMAKLNVKQS